MVQQRQSLVEARREAAARAKLQKEAITRVMEDVRGNAAKASKVVKLVQTGRISLDSLLGVGSVLTSSKARTAKTANVVQLLDMSRASQSAGQPVQGTARFDVPGEEETGAPKVYVSPYDVALNGATNGSGRDL